MSNLEHAESTPRGTQASSPGSTDVSIHRGYLPGSVGRVTEMHASYYSALVGFGQYFESKVATGLAEFVSRLDHPANGLWLALLNQRIVGSIAIDGEDSVPGTAHLRWFILGDELRGRGVGRQLMTLAMAHCDTQAFASTYLWTFSGLNPARHLYEAFGFTLVEELPATQWGKEMTEQRFVRPLGA